MMRSPLAYPLNRGADMDVGGAADLQTDVMRFMAILSLCLVAIFALVQSMPMSPPADPVPEPQVVAETQTVAEPQTVAPTPTPEAVAEPAAEPVQQTITLTRPKKLPQHVAQEIEVAPVESAAEEPDGFTLRFESDAALTRLVAASQVGVYAIEGERARRMTVSESRISFWDASHPNSFHEMELSTVPSAVIDALARTGVDTSNVDWGVTLPGKLKKQLDGLMQEHRGGALVIGTNGNMRLEAT